MLTLCFFKVILNKFFLQKTVVYSKFISYSGCKFLGFFLPKYFHVLRLSTALSATCSRKKSGKGFLSKFGGFSALRPAIRANAHLNAALEMLRENRTFSARKCTRRCISGGRTMFLKHWRFGQIRNSRLAFSAVAAAAASAEMPRSAAIFFATNGTRLGSLRRPLNGSGAI